MKKRGFIFVFFSCFTVVISFISGVGGAFLAVAIMPEDFRQKITQEVSTDKIEIVDEESQTIQVAKNTIPSVVSIVITKNLPVYENLNNDPFFDFSIPTQNGTEEQEVGAGSGFVISEDGMIITNRHVVNDEDASYTVISNDGKKYDAKVLARDTLLDIAFIKIDSSDLKPLQLGTSKDLKIGQRVIAIGNALGEFSNTVSTGIISGLSRDITATDSLGGSAEKISDVIQTDASINFGNSGGPLLDIKGNVIGVNVAVASDAENIGFAIPIDVVKDLQDRMSEDGTIVRPRLGVRYQIINEELSKANNLDVDYGALVQRGETMSDLAVIPGSPADKAGLRENDIILEVDGKRVDEDNPLVNLIQGYRVGDEVELKVLRAGEEMTIEVTLDSAT